MILEYLDFIGKSIIDLSIDATQGYAVPLHKNFTCSQYNTEGFYLTVQGDVMNFQEGFGNHFYQRIPGKVQLNELQLSSCAKLYTHRIPVKLVAVMLNQPAFVEPSRMAERVVWMLSRIANYKTARKINITVEGIDLDKYSIYKEETNTDVQVNLDNLCIFAIEYELSVLSKENFCELLDCCIV